MATASKGKPPQEFDEELAAALEEWIFERYVVPQDPILERVLNQPLHPSQRVDKRPKRKPAT